MRQSAVALPETEEVVSRGLRPWRVRGKLVAWERPLRRADLEAVGDAAPPARSSASRSSTSARRRRSLAHALAALFTTPHFDGYPAMLVRLAKIAPDALEELVIEAWLARACPAAGRARLEEQRPRG